MKIFILYFTLKCVFALISGNYQTSRSRYDDYIFMIQDSHNTLADPRGRQGRPPPGSYFFHFHAVFGKNVKNNSNFGSWRPPPRGNPGSATVIRYHSFSDFLKNIF